MLPHTLSSSALAHLTHQPPQAQRGSAASGVKGPVSLYARQGSPLQDRHSLAALRQETFDRMMESCGGNVPLHGQASGFQMPAELGDLIANAKKFAYDGALKRIGLTSGSYTQREVEDAIKAKVNELNGNPGGRDYEHKLGELQRAVAALRKIYEDLPRLRFFYS